MLILVQLDLTLMFKLIVDIVGLVSIIFVTVFYLLSLFFVSSFDPIIFLPFVA